MSEHQERKAIALLGNLLFGIGFGLTFALLLSLYVAVLALVRGSLWIPEYEVSTLIVIKGYLVGGVLGGAVFGLLKPLARTTLTRTIMGMVVGIVVYGAMATAVEEHAAWTSAPAIIAGVLVGGLLAWKGPSFWK